jgi:signal transduction histidine kinase
VLDVLDDGAGFDPARDTGRGDSYGLTAMRRRLREVGGALAVESAPGDGTAISAQVPVAPLTGVARVVENDA